MKEMSACPKCKQPATTRQARLSPELDNLVDIYQSLETAAGFGSCLPEITPPNDARMQYHDGSQMENFSEVKNMVFNVKVEDDCLSPSAVRQRKHESRERVSDITMDAAELESRKRASSVEVPCRGILPASKRIQLPCPPLPIDIHEQLVMLERKHKALNTHPTLVTESLDLGANGTEDEQKEPRFSHASIGGQARATGSSVLSYENKVYLPSEAHALEPQVLLHLEQPSVRTDALSKAKDQASLQAEEQAKESGFNLVNIGAALRSEPKVNDDKSPQAPKAPSSQEGGAEPITVQDQSDKNRRHDVLLPNQAEQDVEKVTCAFCHTTDDSLVAGPMIHYKKGIPVSGGGKRSGKIFSVHRNCAEWAPGVYYVDDVAKNIPQEVARGHKIKCHVCGLRGAVLGCYVKRCRKSFHYPCAHTLSCRWDDGNFLVLCPEHVASRFPDEGAKSDSANENDTTNVEEKENKASFANECKLESNIATTETFIPSKPLKIEASMEETSRKWPASKWVLCGSGLSPKANELLATFVRYTGVTFQKTWTPCVTHLIAGTDEMGAARRTFKYLMATLEGRWILKVDWLSACMAVGRSVAEEPYEVSIDIHGMIGGPRHARGMAIAKMHCLFEGLRFYFLGEFAAAYKADLQALLTAAGGVILSRMPDASEEDSEACNVMIYSKDIYPDMSVCHQEGMIKARYLQAKSVAGVVGAKVAGHTWILDSVAAYELQPFE